VHNKTRDPAEDSSDDKPQEKIHTYVPFCCLNPLVLLSDVPSPRRGIGLDRVARGPKTYETPCNTFTRSSVVQASRTVCGIHATNVGIVRKASRGGRKTHYGRSALSLQPTDGETRNRETGSVAKLLFREFGS